MKNTEETILFHEVHSLYNGIMEGCKGKIQKKLYYSMRFIVYIMV